MTVPQDEKTWAMSRDHATVMIAVRKMQGLESADKETRAILHALRQDLKVVSHG